MFINKKELKELIDRFNDDLTEGLALDDPETDTERLYIEPFLELLGWDLKSREIRTSRSAGASSKRTDYSFWQERRPLFILEAKATSTSLDGYYIENGKKITFPEKTIQYAWNTNVPVGVLFNFQELRIYNATVKVESSDQALLIEPILYTEMLDRIEDIGLLTKKAVIEGVLADRVRQQNIKQVLPIRQTIDKAILQQIIKWRKLLINHIADRYKQSEKEMRNLKGIVQLFLDRVIFIRVVEDLNLEKMDGLWAIVTGSKKPYIKQLVHYFEYMDKYYNSMLFHKSLLDNIELSDETISSIIKDTYNFRFDKLPIDLFGSFYENYLGHVIEEREIVEDKKFIKAKGIYYTPPQIVDLIITLTLKNKLVNLQLKQSKQKGVLSELTVLDPACGSGSFILRAFDEMVNHLEKIFDRHRITNDFETRKKLLTSCIYGVDLDGQAVEVASTYLLIGLLRDVLEKPLFLPVSLKEERKQEDTQAEQYETLPLFQKTYIEKRKTEYSILHKMVEQGQFHLPTMMGKNATVRNGNSLISGPISSLKSFFGNRLSEAKPFDWNKEFPHIFQKDLDLAGFDIIIGNPPYRNMDEPKEGDDLGFFEKEKNYFQSFSKSRGTYLPWSKYYRRMADIYYFFFYRGISLLCESGLLGYITSRSFLEADYADFLRQFILDSCKIRFIIDFRHIKVFEKPNITTAITIVQKCSDKSENEKNIVKIVRVKKEFEGYNFQDKVSVLATHITRNIEEREFSDDYIDVFEKRQNELSSKPWILAMPELDEIYTRIDGNHLKLKDVCEVGEGMQTGANEIFCEHSEENTILKGLERQYIWKRALNSDIFPYYVKHGGKYAIYIEDIPADSDNDLSRIPRNIKNWLIQNKEKLQGRAAYKRGDCKWFRYTFPLHSDLYHGPRIIAPYRAKENRFYLDEDKEYLCFTDTTVIFPKSSKRQENFIGEDLDLHYILGLLNSKLLEFRYKGIGKLTGNRIREYFSKQVGKLPIKVPDKDNPKELELYETIRNDTRKIQKFYKEGFSMPEGFKKREKLINRALEVRSEIDEVVEVLYGIRLP